MVMTSWIHTRGSSLFGYVYPVCRISDIGYRSLGGVRNSILWYANPAEIHPFGIPGFYVFPPAFGDGKGMLLSLCLLPTIKQGS